MSVSQAFETACADTRLEPQFRVVSIGGERKAFRLEAIYWTVMDMIARRNRRTLSAEIAATLARIGGRANQSAHLRARCAADLLDLLELAEARSATPSWRAVIDGMPQPAFVMTRGLRVLQANAAMRRLLEERGLALDGAASPIMLEAPPALAERVRSETGAVGVCNAVLRDGVRRCVLRTRIVSAGATPGSLLLGFPDSEA
jgi:predicted DNA-binding ribbon-helix-helix protein